MKIELGIKTKNEVSSRKGHLAKNALFSMPTKMHILPPYIDLEILSENMGFMEEKIKIKKIMEDKVQKDFKNENGVVPVKGHEDLLCVNQVSMYLLFGFKHVHNAFYHIVANYVLRKGKTIFVISSNLYEEGRVVSKAISKVWPLEDEKGVGMDLYGIKRFVN